MYKIILSITIAVGLLVSSLYLNTKTNAQVFIQNDLPIIASQSIADPASCPDLFVLPNQIIVNQFYETVDTVLQSANLNSELLNYLFRNYRNTQNQIRNNLTVFENNFSLEPNSELTPESVIASCRALTNETVQNIRFVFLTIYQQMSQRKKDILLFEKYDAINSKFELLQEDLADTNQNIKKFDDLFPCFVNSCISR